MTGNAIFTSRNNINFDSCCSPCVRYAPEELLSLAEASPLAANTALHRVPNAFCSCWSLTLMASSNCSVLSIRKAARKHLMCAFVWLETGAVLSRRNLIWAMLLFICVAAFLMQTSDFCPACCSTDICRTFCTRSKTGLAGDGTPDHAGDVMSPSVRTRSKGTVSFGPKATRLESTLSLVSCSADQLSWPAKKTADACQNSCVLVSSLAGKLCQMQRGTERSKEADRCKGAAPLCCHCNQHVASASQLAKTLKRGIRQTTTVFNQPAQVPGLKTPSPGSTACSFWRRCQTCWRTLLKWPPWTHWHRRGESRSS